MIIFRHESDTSCCDCLSRIRYEKILLCSVLTQTLVPNRYGCVKKPFTEKGTTVDIVLPYILSTQYIISACMYFDLLEALPKQTQEMHMSCEITNFSKFP